MRCVDTNVLVYAHRADLPEHADYRRLLEQLAKGDEPLGLPDLVLSGFVPIDDQPPDFRRADELRQSVGGGRRVA